MTTPRPIDEQLKDYEPDSPFRVLTTAMVNARLYEVLLTIQALEERIAVQTETIGLVLETNKSLRLRIDMLEAQLIPRGAEK